MAVAVLEKKTVTVPPGKIKCYITDRLREDTPEEHVRQRMARSLVEEYGYPKTDIELERTIYIGREKKRADIVIFDAGLDHSTNEHIIIIVEAKKAEVKPTHKDQGIEQLFSYMAATPNAEYGLWVGSEIRAFVKVATRGKKLLKCEDVLDIPLSGRKLASPTSFTSLVPATDVLKDVFRRCHNYISANQGGSKEFAFHEFLKVTFCKVYDERFSSKPEFYITPAEQRTSAGRTAAHDRISALFTEVCGQYGYIFGVDDTIKLNAKVVSYITGEMQKYSLLDTDFDYKGQAYEEIVGANSRGERGEFFTPRNLCDLAISTIIALVGEPALVRQKILDPACGTGGFLRTYVHRLYNSLLEKEIKKRGDNEKAREQARSSLKSICDQNVIGIDFNPVLVRAAQMNLVMHGDGSSNIFHENSLLPWGEWDAKTKMRVKDGSIDVIVTNPPFGKDLRVDDSHVLGQYSLSTFMTKGRRNEMAPQELFIERCWKLLKPDGYAAIVTPDNILSNPNYKFMRVWIVLHFQILASISLPGEMFQPSTGTQTSLLLLKKRAKPLGDISRLASEVLSEPVFLSVPQRIGHDQRGSFIARRNILGDIVFQELKKKRFFRDKDGAWQEETFYETSPVAEDDLPQVLSDFQAWLAENGSAC